MTSRRKLLAAGVVTAGAVVAGVPSVAAAKARRTGLGFDMKNVAGWDTGNPNGIFPPDPETIALPGTHYESPESKRVIFDLLEASGLMQHLVRVPARAATDAELLRVHTAGHLANVHEYSERERGGFIGGPDTMIGHHGEILARKAFGCAIDLALEVWKGKLDNGYMLMRPPGHHAKPDAAMGFCIFNNLAGAVKAVLAKGAKRVLVFDYDVHHGNGTYEVFKGDKRVVVVDMHQAECFPPDSGHITERGVGNILNLDLPPGFGHETALYVMDRVVIPAIERHKPDVIFASSGFDSGFTDPLGRSLLGAMTYRAITEMLMQAADNPFTRGRIVYLHEGGYDPKVVGEYGLAVIEALSGISTGRPSQFDPVVAWQNKGIRGDTLALHRKLVDQVAAFVPQIPH